MSPRRDPSTGKFVSGSKKPGRPRTVATTFGSTIPAADLSGGKTSPGAFGDSTELVDFSDLLHNDEVFHLDRMAGRIAVYMPTTATAEGYALLEYNLTPDPNDGIFHSSPFWSNTVDNEEGIIDLTGVYSDETSILYQGLSATAPSVADTANNMTAGADNAHEDILRVWTEDPPTFDQNDALAFPHQWHVDNVSDHAVTADLALLCEGRVEEIDDC